MDKQSVCPNLATKKIVNLAAEYHRIYLTRTAKEWQLIEKRLQELGKKNLTLYLRSKIPLLDKEFKNCPDCICSSFDTKVQKQQYISAEQFEILQRISVVSKIPENVIVNKLIIEPLLMIP